MKRALRVAALSLLAAASACGGFRVTEGAPADTSTGPAAALPSPEAAPTAALSPEQRKEASDKEAAAIAAALQLVVRSKNDYKISSMKSDT